MYKIKGIFGDIQPEALGQTLVHEHITVADWSMRVNYGEAFCEEDKLISYAVSHFKELIDLGIKTVVDGTPINLGRDIQLIREVAEKSGMNMVASCGFYYMEEPWIIAKSAQQIYDLLNLDFTKGIANTDSVPGIMKAAISNLGITSQQKMLLGVVSKLALEHEVPIFCHHDVSIESGLDIIKTFESNGVSADRVILGHCSDTNNLEYLKAIAETGCYIGMDRLAYCEEGPRQVFNPLNNCVNNIVALCEMGFINQILLSHDMTVYSGFECSWQDADSAEYQEQVTDFTYITKRILPELKKKHLTDRDIEQIMVKNPVNFFVGEK